MKTMRYTVLSNMMQFYFEEVEPNKWIEECWARDEDDMDEWYIVHEVKYHNKEDVESFVELARKAGLEVW